MDNFHDYYWHDSIVQKIEVFEDNVSLSIFNNDLNSYVNVICSKTAGITNLCMWEDTIIRTACLDIVSDFSGEFIQTILMAHPQYEDIDNLPVKKGLLDLAIELTNNIVFHIYCYSVRCILLKSGDGSVS